MNLDFMPEPLSDCRWRVKRTSLGPKLAMQTKTWLGWADVESSYIFTSGPEEDERELARVARLILKRYWEKSPATQERLEKKVNG